jgi:hypothetical protein
MRVHLLLCFIIAGLWNLNAQTPIAGDIKARITSIINNMPGDTGNDYQAPTAQEEDDWEVMIERILAQNYAQAATDADGFGYTLYAFTDNTGMEDKLYYLLEEDSPQSHYWGTYVFNPAACRSELIIQSPHPKFDFNTGKQGIHVMHEVDARAFMMSGTHRCNHDNTTLCSGTTQVCNDMEVDEKFRTSDLAHSDNSIFQATTRQLLAGLPAAVFVQLHGFSKKASDPYVIMSNGTEQAPLPPDYVLLLRDNLLLADPMLTFKIPHIDNGWDRLVGFTNTQGRWINGEAMPCSDAANTPSGQFIHMEQEKTRLRADETGWDKVADALAGTFGCAVLPASLLSFRVSTEKEQLIFEWESAMEEGLSVYQIEHITNPHSTLLAEVPARGAGFYRKALPFSGSGVHYFRLKMIDHDGSYEYSKVVAVQLNALLWTAYPNPFREELHIHITAAGQHYLRLFNNTGQAISPYIAVETDATIPTIPESNQRAWLVLFDAQYQLLDTRLLVREGK